MATYLTCLNKFERVNFVECCRMHGLGEHGLTMLGDVQILISAHWVGTCWCDAYASALSGWVSSVHVLGRDAIPSSFGEPSGIS